MTFLAVIQREMALGNVRGGAEPIDARVLQAFARRFQRSGFDPAALTPCYGLAEAALCVTMKEMKRPLAVETICRETAATEQIAKVVPSNQNGQETLATLDVCDCGPPVVETIIEIRDEHGRVRQSGEIGRVWISSPSLMQGYVGEPEKTAVQQHVVERTGIRPTCVTLVPRHTITRTTTSGKLRRYRLKMNYAQLVQQTQYSSLLDESLPNCPTALDEQNN